MSNITSGHIFHRLVLYLAQNFFCHDHYLLGTRDTANAIVTANIGDGSGVTWVGYFFR